MKVLGLFIPSKKSLWTIALLHLLLLTTIFAGIPLYEQKRVASGYTDLSILPKSIRFLGERAYFVAFSYEWESPDSFEYENVTYRYFFGFFDFNGRRMELVPFFETSMSFIYTNGTRTHYSFKILKIKGNTANILVSEEFTVYNPIREKVVRDYVFQLDMLSGETKFVLLTYPSDLDLKYRMITAYNSTSMLLILRERKKGYLAISPTLSDEMDAKLKNADGMGKVFHFSMSQGILESRELVNTTVDTININETVGFDGLNITESSLKADEAYMIGDDLFDLRLLLIDKQGRLHFRVSKGTEYPSDGNSTTNTAEYLALDPSIGKMVYWDLITNMDIDFMRIAQMGTDEFLLSFYAPVVQGFFNDERYWIESPNFDRDAYNQWISSRRVQLAKFDPFHPTLENYIQFNKSISQTNKSTVIYPRLVNATAIPFSEHISSLGFGTPIFDPISREIGIPLLLLKTEDGYKSIIPTEDGGMISLGDGKALTVQLFTDNLTYLRTNELLGPDEKLKGSYPTSDEIPTSLAGWNFISIIGMMLSANGLNIVVSGYYSSPILGSNSLGDYFFRFSKEEIFQE